MTSNPIFDIYVFGTWGIGALGDFKGVQLCGAGAVICINSVETGEVSNAYTDETDSKAITGNVAAVTSALREVYRHLPAMSHERIKAGDKVKVIIHTNLEGLMKWGTGEWTANKPATQHFQETIAKARAYFDISFEKAFLDKRTETDDCQSRLVRAKRLAEMSIEKTTESNVYRNTVWCR